MISACALCLSRCGFYFIFAPFLLLFSPCGFDFILPLFYCCSPLVDFILFLPLFYCCLLNSVEHRISTMLFNFHFEILQHWQSDALFYQLIMVKKLWTVHVSNKEIKKSHINLEEANLHIEKLYRTLLMLPK